MPAEVMFYRAMALALEGHSDAAMHLAERLRVTDAEQPLLRTAAAEICGWAGNGTAARQALKHPCATGPNFGHATLAMAAGAHDIALEALKQALERRELALIWLRMDKRFDAIRASSRFAALLDRLSTWVHAPGTC